MRRLLLLLLILHGGIHAQNFRFGFGVEFAGGQHMVQRFIHNPYPNGCECTNYHGEPNGMNLVSGGFTFNVYYKKFFAETAPRLDVYAYQVGFHYVATFMSLQGSYTSSGDEITTGSLKVISIPLRVGMNLVSGKMLDAGIFLSVSYNNVYQDRVDSPSGVYKVNASKNILLAGAGPQLSLTSADKQYILKFTPQVQYVVWQPANYFAHWGYSLNLGMVFLIPERALLPPVN